MVLLLKGRGDFGRRVMAVEIKARMNADVKAGESIRLSQLL